MNIPFKIKSCHVTDQGNAEGVIEFNDREFNYVILPPAGERTTHEITIKDIDTANLKKAGFEFDFQPLIRIYASASTNLEKSKHQEKTRKREKNYLLSRLHELKPVLGTNFNIMPEEEYIRSKSAALFATYEETYKNHTKELTIFMDRDDFIVYDNLNRKSVSSPAKTPEHVKEIIDDEIKKWQHKVDFKLLLLAHADEDAHTTNVEPISASEYFKQLQQEDKAHEREILENHLKYLKELGKLGEKAEIKELEVNSIHNTDTDTFLKKRILSSMPEEHIKKMKHPFSADDL